MEIRFKILFPILSVLIVTASAKPLSAGPASTYENRDMAVGINSMSPSQISQLVLNMGNDKVFELIRRLDTDTLAKVFRSVDPYRLAQITKLMAAQAPMTQLAAKFPPAAPQSEYALARDFPETSADLGAYTIIVNPINPVSELSFSDVKKLFTGEYTNWKQVNGPDQPVEVIVMRDNGPAIYDLFKAGVSQDAIRPIFLSAMLPLVSRNPGAIALTPAGPSFQTRFITSQSSVKNLTLLKEETGQESTIAGKIQCDRSVELCADFGSGR
jgi:hypothetical protein